MKATNTSEAQARRERLEWRIAKIKADRNRGRVRIMLRHYAEYERFGVDALYADNESGGRSDPARRGNQVCENHATVSLMLRELGLEWLRPYIVAEFAGCGWSFGQMPCSQMAAGMQRWGLSLADALAHVQDMLLADLEASETFFGEPGTI